MPTTREEAYRDCLRVARNYRSKASKIMNEVSRKCYAKARRVKMADDWKAAYLADM